MKLSLIESGRKLFMIAYPSEQEKIAGILFLLRNGFKITK